MSWSRGPGIRGDRFRLGWRSLAGAVLLAVLLLHGFDRSFVVDGYTMTMLALLVLLALAGELELARIGGFEFKFRDAVLSRAEHDLNEATLRRAEEERQAGAGEPEPDDDARPEGPEFQATALSEPGAAVVAFFAEMEEAIDRLFKPLAREGDEDASLERKVDLLTEWKVITPAEARVVLDLAGLRSAYVHGRGVKGEEVARVVAVGARLLSSLSWARRRVGRAFEEQVEQVLESVRGIRFEREPSLSVGHAWGPHPDFLITSPKQIVVEAKAVIDGPNLLKRLVAVEHTAERFPEAERVLVIPWAGRGIADRYEERTSFRIVPLDRLEPLIRSLVDQ